VVEGRPLDKVVEVRVQTSRDPEASPKVYRWKLEELMYGWHLKKRVCLCTDCHRNVSHERASKAFGYRPKMAYCRACHYHAVKDDYVQVLPLPMLEVKPGVGDQGSGIRRRKAKGERRKILLSQGQTEELRASSSSSNAQEDSYVEGQLEGRRQQMASGRE
jgi:hypothetical protein